MECPKCGSTKTYKNGFDHKTKKQKYLCRNCGKNFYGVYDKPQHISPPSTPKNGEPAKRKIGITEAELRAKFDLTFIVKNKVREIPKGEFLSRSEFIQFCNLKGMSGYVAVIDHPEFDSYKGKAGSSEYWGHPDSIAKMKSDHVLN